jgi:hypothetical protein
MSSVEAAKHRLERAIARLEGMTGTSRHTVGPDQAELVKALEAAQVENATLHATTEQVADGLDRAINRLKAVLED